MKRPVYIVLAVPLVLSLLVPLREEHRLVAAVSESISPPLRDALDTFAADRKLDLEVHTFTYKELFQAVREQLDGTVTFDVITVDIPWLKTFDGATDGKTGRLARFPIADHEQFVLETLPERMDCPAPEAKGCYIGAPYVGNSQLLCYNPKILPAAPSTWDALVKWASQVHLDRTEFNHVMRSGSDPSDVTDEFMPVYWSLKKKGLETSTAVEKAVETLYSLACSNPTRPVGLESFDVAALLLSGKAASGLVFSHWAMRIQQEAQRAGVELAFAEVPDRSPENGVWYLSVPQSAPHRENALAFVEFAIGYEAMKKAASLGNPPTRRDVLETLREEYRTFPYQLQSLQYAEKRPHCSGRWTSEVEEVIGKQLVLAYLDKTTINNSRGPRACDGEYRRRIHERDIHCRLTADSHCCPIPETCS
jgi:spermidine/putrescine-binding protein